MGISIREVGGFGFAIDEEEIQELEERYNNQIMELMDEDIIVIPKGWCWSLYNTGYDEPTGLLLTVDDDIVNAVLRNEEGVSLPDMAVAKAWAKKYLISFTEEKPRLHFLSHTY